MAARRWDNYYAGADYDGDVLTDDDLSDYHEEEAERHPAEYNAHPDVIGGGDLEHKMELVREKGYSLAIKRRSVIRMRRSPETGPCIFSLKYNTLDDVYKSSSSELDWPSWQSLIYRAENVCRHEREHSSFLSRFESSPKHLVGKIHWRFDASELGEWSRIEIEFSAMPWQDTEISLRLIGRQACLNCRPEEGVKLEFNSKNIVEPEDFVGENLRYLDLLVSLESGRSQDDGDDDEESWMLPQVLNQERRGTAGANSLWTLRFEIFHDY